MSMSGRERTKQFDEYVTSVDTALRHPQVADKLGPLASRLLLANANSFLPNQRFGNIKIPRRYKESPDATAIVPVDDEEALRAIDLVGPVLAEKGPWRKLGEHAISSISGVRASTKEMMEWIESGTNEADKPDDSSSGPIGLKPSAGARTVVEFVLGTDDAGDQYYAASRPVIIAKSNLLAGLDQWNQTATIGHEEVHALDIIDNPLLYKMPIGGAASELVAYNLSNAMYDMTSQPAFPRSFTREVEAWRQQNMPENAPFAPDDEQLETLEGWVT